ncbi:hypothetical protein EJB05_08978, partial [Eragrostis curvula]
MVGHHMSSSSPSARFIYSLFNLLGTKGYRVVGDSGGGCGRDFESMKVSGCGIDCILKILFRATPSYMLLGSCSKNSML